MQSTSHKTSPAPTFSFFQQHLKKYIQSKTIPPPMRTPQPYQLAHSKHPVHTRPIPRQKLTYSTDKLSHLRRARSENESVSFILARPEKVEPSWVEPLPRWEGTGAIGGGGRGPNLSTHTRANCVAAEAFCTQPRIAPASEELVIGSLGFCI
jgi:hypothetical protein